MSLGCSLVPFLSALQAGWGGRASEGMAARRGAHARLPTCLREQQTPAVVRTAGVGSNPSDEFCLITRVPEHFREGADVCNLL